MAESPQPKPPAPGTRGPTRPCLTAKPFRAQSLPPPSPNHQAGMGGLSHFRLWNPLFPLNPKPYTLNLNPKKDATPTCDRALGVFPPNGYVPRRSPPKPRRPEAMSSLYTGFRV